MSFCVIVANGIGVGHVITRPVLTLPSAQTIQNEENSITLHSCPLTTTNTYPATGVWGGA